MMSKNNEIIIDEFLKDIETPRTAKEMSSYYQEIIDTVGSNTELIKLSRLRKGLFKEFFEEFIPLCKFANSEFGIEGCKYNIVIGNQNYDGIIHEIAGCRKIEISKYHDGYSQNNIAKELNVKGATEVTIGDVDEDFKSYISYFINCITEKKRKNYIDTDFIFVIDASEIWLFIFDFNKDLLVEKIKQRIQQVFERESRVYLLIEKMGDVFKEDILIRVC
jgi:hypothetical protein